MNPVERVDQANRFGGTDYDIDQAGGNDDQAAWPDHEDVTRRAPPGLPLDARRTRTARWIHPVFGGMQDETLIPAASIGDSRTTIVLWRTRKGSRSLRNRGEGTTKVWMGCSRRAGDVEAAGQEREQQPVCGETTTKGRSDGHEYTDDGSQADTEQSNPGQ